MLHDERYQILIDLIRTQGRVAVAFSGGVDSGLLCQAAHDALGDQAMAITVVSPMLARRELASAQDLAARVGIRHVLIQDPVIEDAVAANPVNRCYHCKKLEFGGIAAEALKHGISVVLDGTNLDDLGDYRPGLQALEELQIMSPLRLAGFDKAHIRWCSEQLGLPTWNKPAFACLASRIPYGQRITPEKLSAIDQAEDLLAAEGFRQFRIRAHGDIARIEVAPEERSLWFDEDRLDRLSAAIKGFGFKFVCLELEGYRTGSLNRQIPASGLTLAAGSPGATHG